MNKLFIVDQIDHQDKSLSATVYNFLLSVSQYIFVWERNIVGWLIRTVEVYVYIVYRHQIMRMLNKHISQLKV